jgi:hypothetical protein
MNPALQLGDSAPYSDPRTNLVINSFLYFRVIPRICWHRGQGHPV